MVQLRLHVTFSQRPHSLDQLKHRKLLTNVIGAIVEPAQGKIASYRQLLGCTNRI